MRQRRSRRIAFASLAIAVLGFLVWGHHMFVSGQSLYAGMVFSILSLLIAIPSAIKVFNWTATLHRGTISFNTPMLYALGFIGLFVGPALLAVGWTITKNWLGDVPPEPGLES